MRGNRLNITSNGEMLTLFDADQSERYRQTLAMLQNWAEPSRRMGEMLVEAHEASGKILTLRDQIEAIHAEMQPLIQKAQDHVKGLAASRDPK